MAFGARSVSILRCSIDPLWFTPISPNEPIYIQGIFLLHGSTVLDKFLTQLMTIQRDYPLAVEPHRITIGPFWIPFEDACLEEIHFETRRVLINLKGGMGFAGECVVALDVPERAKFRQLVHQLLSQTKGRPKDETDFHDEPAYAFSHRTCTVHPSIEQEPLDRAKINEEIAVLRQVAQRHPRLQAPFAKLFSLANQASWDKYDSLILQNALLSAQQVPLTTHEAECIDNHRSKRASNQTKFKEITILCQAIGRTINRTPKSPLFWRTFYPLITQFNQPSNLDDSRVLDETYESLSALSTEIDKALNSTD